MTTSDLPTFSEFVCPDGYISTKVYLAAINFLDLPGLKEGTAAGGAGQERYAHYLELIGNGHAANGVPIVYRTPKGRLIASDLRHSDVAIYARRNVKFHPAIDQHIANPFVSVKIIEVADRGDIPVQRAVYLEKHNAPH
jgi:hypothetical protein